MLAPASVIAAAVSGGLAGALAGLIGGLVPAPVRAAAATLAASAIAIAAITWPSRMPQFNRETEQGLLGLGPVAWAVTNGSLLGLGFTSRIGYWAWYLIPVSVLGVGSPVLGAVIWDAYAFTRLAIAAGIAAHMHRQPGRMPDISGKIPRLRPAAQRITGPVTAGLAATLALLLGV